MKKLDRLLELYKEVTLTQDLVDEYNLLKFEIESMEKKNERLKEQVQRELDDNNELRKTVATYLKIKREFEHGLPTSMKECADICSKIYDLLENEK